MEWIRRMGLKKALFTMTFINAVIRFIFLDLLGIKYQSFVPYGGGQDQR